MDKKPDARPDFKIPRKWKLEVIYFTFSEEGKFLGVFDETGKRVN